jgi:TolA-binding protein
MGDAYLSAGHSDSAIIVLTQTVTRFPKSKYVPSTYLRLGEIAFAANDFGKAYGYFKKVNSEKLVGVGLGDERIGTFYYRFGASAYHTGDYKQAIDNLNTYVRRCDINAIKTKEFYDKASEYLRLAKQKK